MAISHVFAEGIGPFKSVHLNLCGPDGKPSLGPHILAGVNGSGKSTLLKAIAWCISEPDDNFPVDRWVHYLRTDAVARVLLVVEFSGEYRVASAVTNDFEEGWKSRLWTWVADCLRRAGLNSSHFSTEQEQPRIVRWASPPNLGVDVFNGCNFWGQAGVEPCKISAAAYSSVPSVQYLEHPQIAGRFEPDSGCLSFEATVQNEAIQSWLLALYSKRAIARERQESGAKYTASMDVLERGLSRVCHEMVSLVVDIEPSLQPLLRIGPQTLNLSQIPDGVRVTLGWLADFLMRKERRMLDSPKRAPTFEVLLFDEIEGFLHPLWQRRLLPALREALPDAQSIVTSHSPFVISSCRGSMIHVLKVNSDGTAYAEKSVPAPIGESITSTLTDIFGVESRFDVETEDQLARWNDLKKVQTQNKLSAGEEAEFRKLTDVLASRSEELRSLVTTIPELPKATIEGLSQLSAARRPRKGSLASR